MKNFEAGEILLNCIDSNGANNVFESEFVKHIHENVSIPLLAASGAGKVEHFSEIFEITDAEAALVCEHLPRERGAL